MNEQILLISLLVLHAIFTLIFILYGIKNNDIVMLHLIWILFIPLFGPLAGLSIAFEQGRDKDFKALDGLINHTGQDTFFTVQKIEGNVAPAEEVLLIGDAQNKRKMMMSILQSESKQHLNLLLLARYDKDTEVSHFSTATIMQVQHDFQSALQNAQIAVSEDKTDLEAWFVYIQVMDDYISSGLLEGGLLARQRKELTFAIEKVRHQEGGSNLLELCARNYLAQDQVIDAIEAAEDLIDLRPTDEKSWLLRLDICVKTRDEKGLVQLFSRIEMVNIDWSTQGRDYLSYWKYPATSAQHVISEGTNPDENSEVWQRLESVWGALSQYSIATTPLEGSFADYCILPVQTPYDVLRKKSANSIEKALLFSSAAQAQGLETALVFTPIKVCVAIRRDRANNLFYAIDTSLIGLSGFALAAEQGISIFNDYLKNQKKDKYFWVEAENTQNMGDLPMSLTQDKDGSPDPLLKNTALPIEIRYTYHEDFITALYHLYGTGLNDFVYVHLTNTGDKAATLKVETGINGYSYKVSSTVIVNPKERITVKQNPRLNVGAIDSLNTSRSTKLFIRVTQLKEDQYEVLLNDSAKITVHSRHDFIWVNDLSPQNEFELYAAWVIPNDPAVEEMIRKAADYTDSKIITNGYGGITNDLNGGVRDRLAAIWQAQQYYDLTYIDTMLLFSPWYNQRIRTPHEVLEQKSGNCIETSLLYASAAEAMKLEAVLMFVPGHVYVGIRVDGENDSYYFIETTLIGKASFNEALKAGLEKWRETKQHLDNREFDYYWISIKEARSKGIFPMPWR